MTDQPLERMLYSEQEAAEMLGVCNKTLFAEVKAGALPFVRVGRSRKYDINDLKDFIEQRKQKWPTMLLIAVG